jgi:hypothetical protein
MNHKIDFSKPIQTRHGKPARIVCRDLKGSYAVVAIVDNGEEEIPFRYTSEGLFFNRDMPHDYDLVNVKHRIKRSVWINLYHRNGMTGVTHDTKEQADEGSMGSRIACVEVLIDCEEGQGL